MRDCAHAANVYTIIKDALSKQRFMFPYFTCASGCENLQTSEADIR